MGGEFPYTLFPTHLKLTGGGLLSTWHTTRLVSPRDTRMLWPWLRHTGTSEKKMIMVCFMFYFVMLSKWRLIILCSSPFYWRKKTQRERVSSSYSVRIPTVFETRANLRLRVCQAYKLECPSHTFYSNSSQKDTTLKTQLHHHITFEFFLLI